MVSFSAKTQNDKVRNTPKVGLVLSGGGAKGMAHIGVLKVIDSLGIQIDYVAGTSMGSMIGSLYASGYSGKQIDSIFATLNFDDFINDNLPREAKTFRERESSEKYAITLPFDDFKLKFPTAWSRGQNVYNLLSRLVMRVNSIDDFEQLPIPFFCMATDVETGQAVMLNKGNLAQSVMASSALPSLFQPVVINNQVLIDGGVINNYPIDELRDKGMDIIIGVDVQDDLATRKELVSAPEILLQINNYRTIRDMRLKSGKTDVYIKPDIKDFNVISFDESKQIISLGEKAALKKDSILSKIASQQLNKTKRIKPTKLADTIKIHSIKIDGLNNYTRAYVLGKLKLKSNTETSYADFNKGVNNLIATNNFDSFLYELEPSDSGEGYDLNTKLTESDKTTFFRAGIHYDDLYKSSLLLNLTKKQLFAKSDMASLDFILGDNVRYNFEYYIDKGFYWSIGLRSRFDEFNRNVAAQAIYPPNEEMLVNINKIALNVNDFTNQIYLQTLFRKDLSLTLGAEHKRLKLTSQTITSNSDEEETVFEKSDYLSLFGNLKFDTYDNKYFPKEGFLFDGDFNMYLYSSDFNNNFLNFSIAKGTIGYSFKLSKVFSINLEQQGGFRIGEDANPYLNFGLGGYGNRFINNFVPFYGYDFIALSGDSFIKGTFTLDAEIFRKHHINFAANYATVADDIFTSNDWVLNPNYSGYALGYAIETFIGPIEAKCTWSPETKKSIWFFNIGFWF
ncbi:patatin [Pseudalgibacter alginicilyticus]|uniref:Patatin n=1 Tax=Pseudalgibacter alginicilyticus TaxID=1736674 RepID=A0A0N7HZ21_9FLAO|nr:patatin [Pseudalgibacter alginicilyticus]